MRIIRLFFLSRKKRIYGYLIFLLFWEKDIFAQAWQTGVTPMFPPSNQKKKQTPANTPPSRLLPYWDLYEGASHQDPKKKQKRATMYAGDPWVPKSSCSNLEEEEKSIHSQNVILPQP